MNFLKKEIITKKTVGRALIESAIGAVVLAAIVFLCLSFYSDAIQTILNAISSGKASAFEFTIVLFPIILIVALTLELGLIIIKLDKKK